jgi:hypothetical protein
MYSQPGIFNVLDYGVRPGPATLASTNQTNLQAAVDAAVAAGGGTILIPSETLVDGLPETTYNIMGPIYIGTSTSPEPIALIFLGTAQGTLSKPTLQVQNDDGSPLNEDLFSIDTDVGNGEHVGGVTFQDLNIAYVPGATSGAAIHALNGENIRLFRMVLTDTPQGVWFESTLQCSLLECTGLYTSSGNTGTMVMLGNDNMGVIAKETYIAGCVFNSSDKGTSAQGGTGIEIQAAEHTRVTNTRIEAFHEGIRIVPGAAISGGQNTVKQFFGNVSVYAGQAYGHSDNISGTALIIQPQGHQDISNVVFVDCEFEPGDASKGTDGPGIFIDEGLYGSTIDNIRFISCHSTRWSGPGVEITSGSNIEILGGFYSGNASGTNPSGGSGGVSITGPAVGVRIVGASCVGQYPVIINDGNSPSDTQDVGVYIAGGASNILIDSCDLTGNSQFAVSVGGTISAETHSVFIRNCNCGGYTANPINFGSNFEVVQVSNCTGYNDQATAVTTSPPMSGVAFSGATYGYYGSVLFSVEGGGVTQIQIDGHNTNLTSGAFTLGPKDSAKLTYPGPVAPTFVMIGQ